MSSFVFVSLDIDDHVAFPEYFIPLALSLCKESTSYVFPFHMVFFLPCDHGLDF